MCVVVVVPLTPPVTIEVGIPRFIATPLGLVGSLTLTCPAWGSRFLVANAFVNMSPTPLNSVMAVLNADEALKGMVPLLIGAGGMAGLAPAALVVVVVAAPLVGAAVPLTPVPLPVLAPVVAAPFAFAVELDAVVPFPLATAPLAEPVALALPPVIMGPAVTAVDFLFFAPLT